MSTYAPEPYEVVEYPEGAGRPPASQAAAMGLPGSEVTGPDTSPFVRELVMALRAERALMRQAELEAREQLHRGVATAQTDGNGDGLLELFSVPGGATGYLMRAVVDLAGVTPANPATGANLWVAVYAASSSGLTNPALVPAVGALLALEPKTPAVDAQIPCELVRSEHKESAPALVGPATFYVVVDAATAARQIACRWNVLVERPEP